MRESEDVKKKIVRGEIWWADLGKEHMGSEQTGYRPVVILQNDVGNRFSPTTIVAMVTTSQSKAKIPTHMEIELLDASLIMVEQIRTIDKGRLSDRIKKLTAGEMTILNNKIKMSFGIA